MNPLRTSLFAFAFFLVFFRHAEPARILAVLPIPSYSTQVYFRRLWLELAHRGHEVVVMTPNPTGENITRLTEIDMSSAYAVCAPIYQWIIDNKPDIITFAKTLTDVYYHVAEHELALPQVRQIIDDPRQHFDLVMLQSYNPSFVGLPHRFKAPYISIMSLDITNDEHNLLGNAVHSIQYPYFLYTSKNLSFMDRLTRFHFDIMMQKLLWKMSKRTNELNRRLFGANFPDFSDLRKSVDMLFVNNNPLFSNMRPMTANTITLSGGLHINQPKALPLDLLKFLDMSSKGVIYFSLGSNVKSKNLPPNLLRTLLDTFNQLPYNVLWKFEDEQLPGKPPNVKISKWIPQQDVLRHKNIKVFVTQGGAHSLEEALFAHVPVIIIPFFGDQEANADRVSHKKVALHLNAKSLTVKEFKKAIFEIINNPLYKKNMRTLAEKIGDQPQTALERAVWWTEYVIRHRSGPHLKGPEIPLYQYFYLDIWAFLIGCLTAVVITTYFLYIQLYICCKSLFFKTTMKLKKS